MPFDQYCRNKPTFCLRSTVMVCVKMGKSAGSGIFVAIMPAGKLYAAREWFKKIGFPPVSFLQHCLSDTNCFVKSTAIT